jgi:hypothetical protein
MLIFANSDTEGGTLIVGTYFSTLKEDIAERVSHANAIKDKNAREKIGQDECWRPGDCAPFPRGCSVG